MLVGQGPGGRESIEGVPFVGRSGVYLDGMLADASIDRSISFVTNATRCRPPIINGKERTPTPDEINTCRKYLIEEVQRVRPQAIVALGDAALRSLCKTSGVKSKRGQSFKLHPDFGYACPVYVTYHPAAVLRTQPLRRTVVSDLRRVRDRGLEAEKIAWERINDGSGAFYPDERYVAYDIETYDENGEVTDAPTQIAFAVPDNPVIVYPWRGVTPLIARRYVSHFGWDFDDKKTGIESERDTAALAYLDDETQPLGLESLCVKYLGVRGWKEDRNGAVLGSNELAEYNARDAINTLRLHDVLVERLGPRIKIADLILLPGRRALDECSRRGILIDGLAVAKARKRFAHAKDVAAGKCRRLAHSQDVNPGSYQQVANELRHRGYFLPTTPTGEDCTDKAALGELGDPFADAVLDYREAVKADSTYGIPYERAAASADGRMHNEYTIIRTLNGRTSAKRSNVQNLDRELNGFLIMDVADYSSIEFRIAAWCARELNILRNYTDNPHWDPHLYFASLFYNKPLDHVEVLGPNSERQIAKSANFSQLYLGTDETLVEYGRKVGAHIPHATARAAHLFFRHTAYPGFKRWWGSVLRELRAQGYVESATGRRRNFGDYNLLSQMDKTAALREAVNFKVASLTVDVALLGLSACHRAAMPVCYFGHDAIGFEAGFARDNREAIRRCMVEEPVRVLKEEFGVNLDVPLTIEVKTATTTKNQSKERTESDQRTAQPC